mmetsp:Transcript_26418/g.37196  ORF Transcript_26418/g.37196 Transcript_26418/m.37196 type:complete len:80 (-) Transcript_26418:84-323(-)
MPPPTRHRTGTGLAIEAFKFSLYIGLPVIVTWYFLYPENRNKVVEKSNLVVYPPENPTIAEVFKGKGAGKSQSNQNNQQ